VSKTRFDKGSTHSMSPHNLFPGERGRRAAHDKIKAGMMIRKMNREIKEVAKKLGLGGTAKLRRAPKKYAKIFLRLREQFKDLYEEGEEK
jgi:hypothetical protein